MNNSTEILYCAAIYLAAENGHRDTVKHLTKMDIILSEDVVNKFSAFYMAARNGSLDVIKHFIDENYLSSNTADIHEPVKANDVCESNTAHLLIKVLDNMVGINNEDEEGNTCLHYAALQGNAAVVSNLLNHGANPRAMNKCYEKPIHIAASNGFNKIVRLLVEYGTNINALNENKDTALHCAAQNGHTNVVQELLKLGAVSLRNEFGYLPIHYSQSNEINILLSNQIIQEFKSSSGNTLLHVALLNGHTKYINSILKYDTNIVNAKNSDGNTGLHLAAMHGYEDATKLLIENGADIESRNALTYTPLHCAIWKNKISTAFILLEAGADYKSKTNINSNPFHFAAEVGSKELVEWFIKKGVDVKISNNEFSPLMYATKNGHVTICEILLDLNEDMINDTNNLRSTALHYAVEYYKYDVVKMLLKYRPKILNNDYNQTPLDISRLRGENKMTYCLEEYIKPKN